MTNKRLKEITDDVYCRDKSCKHPQWRQSNIEREDGYILLTFYCIKCLCLTFMNFNTEYGHNHEEDDLVRDTVN